MVTSLVALIVFSVFAALIQVLVAGFYVGLSYYAWAAKCTRTQNHDVRNGLHVLTLATKLNKHSLVEDRLEDLREIVGSTDPEDIVISHYVSRSATAMCEDILGANVELQVVDNVTVHAPRNLVKRCLNNLFMNAVDATQRLPKDAQDKTIYVKVHSTHLTIQNAARPKDMKNVRAEEPGHTSKSGNGHGIGRESVVDICQYLGWTLEYVAEENSVITVLRWAPPPQ